MSIQHLKLMSTVSENKNIWHFPFEFLEWLYFLLSADFHGKRWLLTKFASTLTRKRPYLVLGSLTPRMILLDQAIFPFYCSDANSCDRRNLFPWISAVLEMARIAFGVKCACGEGEGVVFLC